MDSLQGRPIGLRSDTDAAKYLARHTNAAEIRAGLSNAYSWLYSMRQRKDPDERERGIRHWEHRIRLLKTKALLQGITLEERTMQEYKLIVAGGRDFVDYQRAHAVLFALAEEAGADRSISIVSGMARGADRVAYEIAKAENIKCYEFPADWNQYGKRAGYLRNENMARVANGLLAFWDGKSRGTAHMIKTMRVLGKPVQIVSY